MCLVFTHYNIDVVTHMWVSGVPGPAVDSHHDPLAEQGGGLARLNADTRNAAVSWCEKVSGWLKQEKGGRINIDGTIFLSTQLKKYFFSQAT